MDDRLRKLERDAASGEPAARLRLELARIQAGTWLTPEQRFGIDAHHFERYLNGYAKIAGFTPEDFRIEVDSHISHNRAETLEIRHLELFTTHEVNEPGSFLHSQYLVAIWLIYPTIKGVIDTNQISELCGIRNVCREPASPAYGFAQTLTTAAQRFFTNFKVILTDDEITAIAIRDLKLTELPCTVCGRTMRYERKIADLNVDRQGLYDFTGQSRDGIDAYDDLVGVTYVDREGTVHNRCFQCIDQPPYPIML